jgi:hypothetical protein
LELNNARIASISLPAIDLASTYEATQTILSMDSSPVAS